MADRNSPGGDGMEAFGLAIETFSTAVNQFGLSASRLDSAISKALSGAPKGPSGSASPSSPSPSFGQWLGERLFGQGSQQPAGPGGSSRSGGPPAPTGSPGPIPPGQTRPSAGGDSLGASARTGGMFGGVNLASLLDKIPTGESLMKGVSASLALPIAAGFGEQLGKARGWKELDEQLMNFAARLRQTGGAGSAAGAALGLARLASTAPLALLGGAGIAMGAGLAVASYGYQRQANGLAPYNATMAGSAMQMEMGDFRRSVALSREVESTFKRLGDSLNAFKDQLVPLQSFGLNTFNRAASFGLGASGQVVADVDKAISPMLAALPSALMGMLPNLAVAGQVAGGAGDIGGAAVRKMLDNPGGLVGAAVAGFDPTGLLGKMVGAKGLGDFFSQNVQAAVQDPNVLAGLAGRGLNAVADRAWIAGKLDDIEKVARDKPDLVGAGMAAGNWDALRAAARGENPLKGFLGGFERGMKEQEARVEEAEDKANRAMTIWSGRMHAMANHAMLNRFPMRAPNVAANAARGGGGARVNAAMPGGMAGVEAMMNQLPNNARNRAAIARREQAMGIQPRFGDPAAAEWNRRNIGNPFMPPRR